MGAKCTGGCDVDDDCATGLRCDTESHTCVACVGDSDCPLGTLCRPSTHTCLPSCSAEHGCGDAGLCEVDAGFCVECLGDGDCGDPTRPRCDDTRSLCVPCLPEADNCGAAEYCAPADDAHPDFHCAPGCKSDTDCNGGSGGDSQDDMAGALDGGLNEGLDGGANDGALSDGGVGDGMSDGATDGGVMGDGGASNPSGAGGNRCDVERHQCVQCLGDDDCPLGKVCNAGLCGDGCTDTHGCDDGRTCCGGQCSDLAHDATHCGDCGSACPSGAICCNGACSDPLAGDGDNCGACGLTCSVQNGSPTCASGNCAVSFCDAGWADCNGKYDDGCETHTDDNVNHCGGCNTVCDVENALPQCVDGACQVATCVAPYADCDGRVQNGCEIDTRTDAQHCGACGQVCSSNHIAAPTCAGGLCNGACEAGWADCDGDKLSNGCETFIGGDTQNCGRCGTVCSQANGVGSCQSGACQMACNAGYADCDGEAASGCETALNTLTNCGGCDVKCTLPHATTECTTGACRIATCEAGWSDCDGDPQNGCETHTATDAGNCGTCGHVCSAENGGPTCSGGTCSIACTAGFADCNHDVADGCETQVATDAQSCGVCGTVCSTHHVVAASCGGGTCNGACAPGWADCNGNKQVDGCEVSTDTDVNHCGACGHVCVLAHATPTCSAGACQIVSCEAGWSDCDGDPQNGCETHTAIDTANCGTCGLACSTANGTPSCVSGACQIACASGYANCDGSATNGCEVNLENDKNHCGGCAVACNLGHANSACSGGTCTITACLGAYQDCDGLPGDGCEVDTTSSVQNCGGCGMACSSSHGAPSCSGGTCAITCAGGFLDCNDSAADGCEVSTTTDAANCGGCDRVCSSNHVSAPSCTSSVCDGTCAPGYADCNGNKLTDGCETDLRTVANCGGCGVACSQNHIAASCTAGQCDGTCQAGWDDCDGDKRLNGCETNINTVASCGDCGQSCVLPHATPTCTAGTCQIVSCEAGWSDCDGNSQNGCETHTAVDTGNCGTCGLACSAANGAPSCVSGACQIACASGYANCDGNVANGCETDTNATTSCGGCGLVCSTNHVTASCSAGGCEGGVCASGWADCDGNKRANGCETNVATPQNCGGCGVACSSNHVTPQCTGGLCAGACLAGFADCNGDKQGDGCECDLANGACDAGACKLKLGRACGGDGDCLSGACCGGVCVDANTDAQNCGGCGMACSTMHATSACMAGGCQIVSCQAGWSDCDGDPMNGCEVDESTFQTDRNHCGACGNVCPTASQCVSGACTAPATACTTGNDPETGSGYVFCSASPSQAWISAQAGGGSYHAQQICQRYGYGSIGSFGGTWGKVCDNGDSSAPSCSSPGSASFNGQGYDGDDAWGAVLSLTVMWTCVP